MNTFKKSIQLRIAIEVFLIVFVTLIAFSKYFPPYVDFYEKKLQVPLFSGFLTLGSFLLSVKTFIVIKLKEGIYESPLYKKRFDHAQSINRGEKLHLYDPLKKLSGYLIYSVFAALITSIVQIVVGSFSFQITVAFCLSLSAMTMTLVLFAWWEIKANLECWFDLLEKEEDDSNA